MKGNKTILNNIGQNKLCEAEVRKNLVLADLGKALTLPLATLNRNCEFRKEWEKIQRKWHGLSKEEIERKAKQKEYSQRPEIKAKRKEYYQRPEIKAKIKEYNQKYIQRKKNSKNGKGGIK